MKKGKLLSSIAFVLSVIMLAVSGAIFVHSAQQQSASTSLTVNFNGQNVNFTANAWYQVKNTATHPYLVNSNGTEGISISASDAPSTATLNVQSNNSIELTASNTYVLFTYKFANTASTGAYGMEVSLTGSTPVDDNIDVKYLVSSADATDYYSSSATDEAKISALTTKVNAVTGTSAFSNVFIQAGHYKYFYILVSLKDNTISATYNNTLTWNVTCSNETEDAITVSVSGPGLQNDTYHVYYLKTETEPAYGSCCIANPNFTGWTLVSGNGSISVPSGYSLTFSGYTGYLTTSSTSLNPFSIETSGGDPGPEIFLYKTCKVYIGSSASGNASGSIGMDGTDGKTFANITENFSLYFDAWTNGPHY